MHWILYKVLKKSFLFSTLFYCLCFSAGQSSSSEDKTYESSASGDKTYHAFSGSVLNVPAPEITSVRESTLESAALCQTIKSSLIQVSSSMGMAVGDEIESGCNDELQLTLPGVKRITTLSLERTMYIGYEGAESAQTDQTDLAPVTIKVYPDDQLNGLKIWAMMNVLYIKDAEGHLIEALDRYDIGYHFRQSGLSADKSVELTAGHGKIIFKEETAVLPMIKAMPALVTVEMPFLQGLSNDPAKQKVLAELFLNLKKTKTE